ncbi:MAG: bis(5'-nucleosyl)-tetraphosphatase [Nitrososphaerales archaeon]
MKEEHSAGAVLFRENSETLEYLLLHYHAGHWDFPKGNVEKGEGELDTVRREVKEETSINSIEFIDGFRKNIEYNYKRNGKLVHKKVVFYLAKTDVKDIKLSFEHKGYGWMNYEQALKRLTYKNAKFTLEAANSFLNKVKGNNWSMDSYLKE